MWQNIPGRCLQDAGNTDKMMCAQMVSTDALCSIAPERELVFEDKQSGDWMVQRWRTDLFAARLH